MSAPARHDLALLAVALVLRAGLAVARFAAAPLRFANVEEAYNATVAWLLGHAPVGDLVPTLQYRSFCGGCSVVSVLGAPALLLGDHAWAWKLVPLGWAAATQAAGFLALHRLAGRPAALAWLALSTVPPLGLLDLSLMAWGNHQESSLFVLLALAAFAAGRPFWLGLSLGVGLWFVRTTAYAAVVLVPLGLWQLRGGRGALLAGLALGLSPLLLPAGGGDHGWYRFDDPIGAAPGGLARRVGSLFAPAELAGRLWLPRRDLAAGGVAVAVAGVGGALAAGRAGRVLLALQAAWVALYCATNFPIFLVSARVPVNNIRYHAPWGLLLTLGAAVGVGALWARGWRAAAAFAAAAVLAPNAWALASQRWSPDARAWELGAVELPTFVTTALPRLDAADLAREADDPRAAALLRRMRGLRLGHELGSAEAITAAAGDGPTLGGVGEALVEACAAPERAAERLAAAPPADRAALGRGLGLTLGLCEARRGWGAARLLDALGADGLAAASAAGPALLEACGPPDTPAAEVAACAARSLAALPEPVRGEVAFGVGRAWGGARASAADAAVIAAALGEPGRTFQAGAADPAAGTRIPAWARRVPGGG